MSAGPAEESIAYDPFDVAADVPIDALRDLRAGCPVPHIEVGWLLTTHADVKSAVRDVESFRTSYREPGIVVPENTVDIEVNEQGIVSAYVENDPVPVELGQLSLTTFVNDAGLRPLGNNILEATNASGDPQQAVPGDPGVGLIRQGFLENSNVNIIQQITDLISAQRAYEMNSKAITTADQMMSVTNEIK